MRLRLRALCLGALAYMRDLRGSSRRCTPRSPPTNTFQEHAPNAKVLAHPFREQGQTLPPRWRAPRQNCPRCQHGRQHKPGALNLYHLGWIETEDIVPPLLSGVLTVPTLPLCIWATQTRVASQAFGIGQVTPNATAMAVTMQQPHQEEAKSAQVLAKEHNPFNKLIVVLDTVGDADHSLQM